MKRNTVKTRFKIMIILITFLTVILLTLFVSIFNGLDEFNNNWFLVSLSIMVVISFRLLFEVGAYDSILYSAHKVGKSFGSNKQSVINELADDEKTKSFRTINDFVAHRKEKRSKRTTYVFIGALFSLVASLLTFFV